MDSEPIEDALMEVDAEVDEEDDEAPLFISPEDAVEVKVDDTDIPMDDDDDDEDEGDDDIDDADKRSEQIVDMAQLVIKSHGDAVYAVACAVTASDLANSAVLRLVSGGGDDKAFWHAVNLQLTPPQVQTASLEHHHQFKDSVSAIAANSQFIGFDTTKPPNPEWVAVGGLDGSIVLYGEQGNKCLPLEGPSADIEWLCWHPKGGNVLLVGSSDATVWMYHTTLNKCLQVFVGHEDAVTCGAFSADGKVALTASADGTLRVWAPKTGKSKHVFRFAEHSAAAALTCMATHGGSDEQLVIVGGDDGQAHVCHVANKKLVASLRHYDPTRLNNNNNNPTISNGTDDEEETATVPSGVEAVGFAKSNPNWCATGGIDGVLKIWDLANQGQCRHACQVTATRKKGDGITQLTWHPTLPLVITSTCRGELHVWDARSGQLIQTLSGHEDVINDMDVSFLPSVSGAGAGKAVIVTASDDRTVRLFHLDLDAALQAAELKK